MDLEEQDKEQDKELNSLPLDADAQGVYDSMGPEAIIDLGLMSAIRKYESRIEDFRSIGAQEVA